MERLNLDQKAAQYAQKIVNDGQEGLERLITKTLGVLQEQGVYACMLFLFSRTSNEKEQAKKILPRLRDLLKELPTFKEETVPADDADSRTFLEFYSDHVCNELDTLLLVKELYEQTLIYARYGAKAANK